MITRARSDEPIHLLGAARHAWERMLAAIGAAERRVHLEVYAFMHDHIGGSFIRALGEAAARGVAVDVVVDAWGSMGSAHAVVNALRHAGCRARVFDRFHFRRTLRLGRNHRKLLVVDDDVAFVGGINIGDRFAEWHDVAVELRGQSALALARRLDGEHQVPQLGPTRIHLSRLGGGRRLYRRYVKAFAAARERLVVAHSYFLPGRRLIRQLLAARRRGVDVELLLPGRSDVPGAKLAMSALYEPLLRAGVRIYEWQPTVLHAKLAAIDRHTLLVGSFNLDPYSMANLEALVVSDDRRAAAAGDAWIAARIAQARRIESADGHWLSHWLGAVVLWFVRALARLL